MEGISEPAGGTDGTGLGDRFEAGSQTPAEAQAARILPSRTKNERLGKGGIPNVRP